MKKIISTILAFALFITALVVIPDSTAKADTISFPVNETTTYEYFEDGSYYMTTLVILPSTERTTTNITVQKTGGYLNSDNEVIWSATLTGKFTYNGSTSSCTDASISTYFNSTVWKLTSSSASKSGSTASGTATAKAYYLGVPVATKSVSLSITCDKDGNLS